MHASGLRLCSKQYQAVLMALHGLCGDSLSFKIRQMKTVLLSIFTKKQFCEGKKADQIADAMVLRTGAVDSQELDPHAARREGLI